MTLCILVSDKPPFGQYGVMITEYIPDLGVVHPTQTFPLYVYDSMGRQQENITKYALELYQLSYDDDTITKRDIFNYVYGILHNTGYHKKYRNNLYRGLPHIPLAPDFWAFSKSGKELIDLHLDFVDCITPPDNTPITNTPAGYTKTGTIPDYPKKIRHGKKPNDVDMGPRKVNDKYTIQFYDNKNAPCDITTPKISYTISGRTPVEWFVTNYRFKRDIPSGRTNYPCYNLTGIQVEKIILNMVHIGVTTDRIIRELPTQFEDHQIIYPKRPKQQTMEMFIQ